MAAWLLDFVAVTGVTWWAGLHRPPVYTTIPTAVFFFFLLD